MSRITKNELVAINASLASQCDALRHEVSALRAQLEARPAQPSKPVRVHTITLPRVTDEGAPYSYIVARTTEPKAKVMALRAQYQGKRWPYCLVVH